MSRSTPDKPAAADTKGSGPADEPGLTYEQARAELEQVVRSLDDPDLPLDDMMALWERGEKLATLCEARLEGARARFDEVSRGDDPFA